MRIQQCPVCFKSINEEILENHINKCLEENMIPTHIDNNSSYNYGPQKNIEDTDIQRALNNPLSFSPKEKEAYGNWRGIQGENNSCYIDSTIYAMFAFTNKFDFLISSSNEKYDENEVMLQQILKLEIVNLIRLRNYVCSENIIKWRLVLDNWLSGNIATTQKACNERDIEELLMVLFKCFHTPNLISIITPSNENPLDINLLQLFTTKPMEQPTVQWILEEYLKKKQKQNFVNNL